MLILVNERSLHRILERRPRQSHRPGLRRVRRNPVWVDKTSCADDDLCGWVVYVFFTPLWEELDRLIPSQMYMCLEVRFIYARCLNWYRRKDKPIDVEWVASKVSDGAHSIQSCCLWTKTDVNCNKNPYNSRRKYKEQKGKRKKGKAISLACC